MEVKSVSFSEAISLYFSNYTNFSGRSRRSEYWWVQLFTIIMSVISYFLPIVGLIWGVVTLLPGLALVVRRLHDTGHSGWWYFILLIPIVGAIVMLVWMCSDSTEDNKWGPNPKQPTQKPTPELPIRQEYRPEVDPRNATVPEKKPNTPPAVPSITLQLCAGAMAGTTYACTPGSTVILGRDPSKCKIALNASYKLVSAIHCRIQFHDKYATVTDLQSTNGTYVNGVRLIPGQPVNIQNGGTINLAHSGCVIQIHFA